MKIRTCRGRPPRLLLPMLGFGLFLLVGTYVPRLPFMALAVLGVAAVVAVIAVVVASCREERRFNERARARFYATPRGRAILGLDPHDEADNAESHRAGAGR